MTEDKIIAHLFNSDSLADVETYRIEEIITRYPYFALPRYWLARKQRWQDKLSSNTTDTTDKQAIARARLFAHDPFVCLQYLLTPFEQPQIHSALPIAGSLVEETLPDTSSTETSERESSTPAVESETRSEVPETQKPVPASIAPADADSPTESGQPEAKLCEEEPLHSPWAEPLYTRDYFAYAGITLGEDEADLHRPTTAQMKSFTEWLRNTRRPIHRADPDSAEEETDEPESHTEAPFRVITESMANIWLQQGQPLKAIEVLEQLRLLNPEKSDYFAQRIATIRNQI